MRCFTTARTLAIFILLCASLTAEAAILPTQNVILGITATPEFPRPGESVTFTAHIAGDASDYAFVWTWDGAFVTEKIGAEKITMKAGPAGSRTEISVTLVDNRGVVHGSATYVLRPADVDILWEGDTYVPPFYLGRPLPTPESEIVLQAVPHLIQNGASIPAEELVYRWEVNGSLLPGSGYGKSSMRVQSPSFDAPLSVSVRAETQDSAVVARSQTTIRPVRPRVVVYEDAPLSRVAFNRAVAGITTFSREEVSFRAFPLFVENINDLTYQWKLNGVPFKLDVGDPRTATFRKTEPGTGIFSVEFSFKNARRMFENAASAFTVSLE